MWGGREKGPLTARSQPGTSSWKLVFSCWTQTTSQNVNIRQDHYVTTADQDRNRPLCNQVWAQTDLSILQATPFRAQKSDSCFFADYSCGLALVHPPVERCRFPAIELPLLPKSIQLRVMLHFYELSPKAANVSSNSISLPSHPLTRMPTVPRGMFSLLVMSNKPNLLNYRCAPVGLWHWKAMTVENSTNNSFSFLTNCYVLDTAPSNTTALECRYYYYYSDLKVEDIEVKLDKYLPKVTQLLRGGPAVWTVPSWLQILYVFSLL